MISNYWTQLDEKGQFVPTSEQNEAVKGMVQSLSFWTEAMKAPREKLAGQ
jgi:hypothetical protein